MFLETSVPDGVRKQLIHPGKGPLPTYVKNTRVTFHYRAIKAKMEEPLDEAKIAEAVVDDTRTMGSGPFELLIGREFKIEAWEEAIKEMLIGEVSRYYCPYQIAAGYPEVSRAMRAIAKSKKDGLPPPEHHHTCSYTSMMQGGEHPDLNQLSLEKSPLAFEFELLSVDQPGEYEQSVWALSDQEMLEKVPKLKEKGNVLYRSGSHDGAADAYHEALGYLEQMSLKERPHSEEWKALEELKVPLLLNYAQCKLLCREYTEVVHHTTSVLEFDGDNVKALFRRAKAHAGLWNLAEAERDFERAVSLNPSLAGAAKKELTKLKEDIQVHEEEQRRKLRGRMFN